MWLLSRRLHLRMACVEAAAMGILHQWYFFANGELKPATRWFKPPRLQSGS
jgi:hypothetical protein